MKQDMHDLNTGVLFHFLIFTFVPEIRPIFVVLRDILPRMFSEVVIDKDQIFSEMIDLDRE